MEFRLTPLILVVLQLLWLCFIHPGIHQQVQFSFAANYAQTMPPVIILLALSIGTYLRHTYYSTSFKLLYWLIQIINIGLCLSYVYTIHSQHLS